MKLCIHKRKDKNNIKGYFWCNYFRKVFNKGTCDRCHKSKCCGRYIGVTENEQR